MCNLYFQEGAQIPKVIIFWPLSKLIRSFGFRGLYQEELTGLLRFLMTHQICYEEVFEAAFTG